jgi:hypothetical protein
MLDWEEFRLLQWGQRVGLSDGNVQNRRLNWDMIKEVLRQLNELLTNTKTLKERYHLERVKTEKDSPQSLSTASTFVSESSTDANSNLNRSLWSCAPKTVVQSRADIIRKTTSPLKKLRWASLDQDRIRELVSQITYFNNCLQGLLESAEQDFVRVGLAALLRDLVSRSTDRVDIDLLRVLLDKEAISGADAVDAAAILKQARLLTGVDKRKGEEDLTSTVQNISTSSPNIGAPPPRERPKLSKLSPAALIRKSPKAEEKGREVATYNLITAKKIVHACVLMEWKRVDKNNDQRLQKRIQELCFLMTNLSDTTFHCPKFIGYLKRELSGDYNAYAYVWELVNLSTDTYPEIEPQIRPLSTLFDHPRRVSLSERYRIAHDLAETVLQLHTAGWLHKAICSDNILFVERGSLTWENGTVHGPYITGYEYSRNTFEDTEKFPADPTLELYQHPLSQGSGQVSDVSFRKSFDLYALGCVLVELALWQNLEKVLYALGSTKARNDSAPSEAAANTVDQEAHERRLVVLRGKDCLLDRDKNTWLMREVAFHAGEKYRRVVDLSFFSAAQAPSSTDDGMRDEDDDLAELTVHTQLQIVEVLGSLKVL